MCKHPKEFLELIGWRGINPWPLPVYLCTSCNKLGAGSYISKNHIVWEEYVNKLFPNEYMLFGSEEVIKF